MISLIIFLLKYKIAVNKIISNIAVPNLSIMKTIKIFVFALLSLATISVSAQFNLNLTFGPQIPTGDFSDGYNLGLGAGAQANYFITDHSSVGLGLGYYSFGSDVDDISCATMPITANYMYRMGSEEGFMPYL